jgi:Cof subfamily protein (haloacid dehalogenase superfamily)
MNGIALVLSDVDGTLVTKDKRLTPAVLAAVHRLDEAGIGFTIASSRPPLGLRMLIEPLKLKLPFAAFNGGTLLTPKLEALEEHFVAEEAASATIRVLAEFGISIWVFADGLWHVTDAEGDYVDLEQKTIQAKPTLVPDFGSVLARAGKIVGACRDFERLDQCEAALKAALGSTARATRSQRYYLDITPAGLDKGSVVDVLSRRLSIPTSAIATIGDMDNDVPMFRRSGFSIAMGNATDSVKSQAKGVTASNEGDGFAVAVDRYILGAEGRGPRAPE